MQRLKLRGRQEEEPVTMVITNIVLSSHTHTYVLPEHLKQLSSSTVPTIFTFLRGSVYKKLVKNACSRIGYSWPLLYGN